MFQNRVTMNLEHQDDAIVADTSRATHSAQQQHGGCGSYIESIKSHNLAGMVGNEGSAEISIDLADEPNLVAVTGETASGKSVLIAKAANLVTGGTASPTMLPPISGDDDETRTSEAVVEMTIQLDEPHLSMVGLACNRIGLDASEILSQDGKLVLKRALSLQSSKSSSSKPRLKSTCEINGRTITLKAMKAIAGPLLTIVDAAVAAAALSKPNLRLAVIDTAVPIAIKSETLRTKTAYRKARRQREKLERELNSQVLPPSYSHSDNPNDEAIEMLRHWVDELDAFEARMIKFRESAISPIGSSIDSQGTPIGSAQLFDTLKQFEAASWFDCSDEGVSEYYTRLLDFRELVKDMDDQLQAAYSARDALAALSQPDSAVTALERARSHLFDATGGQGDSEEGNGSHDTYSAAVEDAHERLNAVEDALSNCVNSLENTNTGLIPTLQRMVGSIGVSLEEIDSVIGDWSTLSRKHAISPFSLPSCHRSLRAELDGSIEARTLLPQAKAKEKDALIAFDLACGDLTAARQSLCNCLSTAVTGRLPSLGIRSHFEARLNASIQKCTDSAAYGEGSGLGTDSVDFILRHQPSENTGENCSEDDGKGRGEKLESIGSAGEKARIILAIETEFPGSVGALCGRDVSSVFQEDNPSEIGVTAGSVAVIYDEIDSHVGGRAAVAMAKLLLDQTRPQPQDEGFSSRGGQVVCITHSPSIAAVADRHVVIQKTNFPYSVEGQEEGSSIGVTAATSPVLAALVEGESREEELGRMCGGDLAREESIQFAAALLREGRLQKNGHTNY